jgi:methylated-DNA-[protein]-cysteine S-methyltransferase
MRYEIMKSPLGLLTIAEEENWLRFILFGAGGEASNQEPDWQRSSCEVVHETIRQLQEYFEGKRTRFELPLKPAGTPFQMDTWRELQKIPYGTVISYRELAVRIGRPRACRGVGAANGANPIPIVIPCHRVVGSNGKMTGYGGGVWRKEALLKLERQL